MVERAVRYARAAEALIQLNAAVASGTHCSEAPTGVEPVMEVLQTSALPLGYGAVGSYKLFNHLDFGNPGNCRPGLRGVKSGENAGNRRFTPV